MRIQAAFKKNNDNNNKSPFNTEIMQYCIIHCKRMTATSLSTFIYEIKKITIGDYHQALHFIWADIFASLYK